MSSIGPGIAGSVAQAAAQQGDVSRARDKVKKQEEEEAKRLHELMEKHLESVEDSASAEDDPLRIKDEERDAQRHRRRREQQDQRDTAELSTQAEGDTSEAINQPAPPPPLQGPQIQPGSQLDLEA